MKISQFNSAFAVMSLFRTSDAQFKCDCGVTFLNQMKNRLVGKAKI